MTEVSQEQSRLMEIRRLASLLLQVVNTTDICVSKLRNGFVEKSDITETSKTAARLHAEILQIDADADNALNGESLTRDEGVRDESNQ